MFLRSVLVAMAAGVAAPALAMQSAGSVAPAAPSPPAAGSSPQVIAAPAWERTPSGDDLVRLYPPAALDRGLNGAGVMACNVQKDGTLTGCTLVQETPAGHGFGKATLATAPYFKMTPTTPDGLSVEGGKVIVPINWQTE